MLQIIIILIAIYCVITPSSAVICYTCANNRDITCRLLELTADNGFSRYECTANCNQTEDCPYCRVLLTNTKSENFYKMTYIGCPSPGRLDLNDTCSATNSVEFSNSSYILSLFTQNYMNTSLLPQNTSDPRRSTIFPPFLCACNTSYCNQLIQFSFLHDVISFPTSPINTTIYNTTVTSLPTLVHIPPEYLAFIAVGVFVAFLIAVLMICPLLIWKCYRVRNDFSSYHLADDKTTSCPHEMATLSSPEGFHEDPELARVPILTDLHLSELIGSGKYGHVWRCTYLGREMACKVWLSFEMNAWRSERAIFSQETTYHPNIVRYIHSGFIEENNQLELVTKGVLLMELCSRGSLCNFLEMNTLSWEVASRFSFEIASGISYLHSHTGLARADKGYSAVAKCPIAHRDIKSSNVLIRGNMSCCVSDLGLAIALNPNHTEESFANAGQVGTPFYMAPEALTAKINLKNLDSFKQMDVFSLGLVLWEIFCRCEIENGPSLCLEHKIPFSDLVQGSLLDKSRLNRTQLIHQLKDLHQTPIDRLLSMPNEWKDHNLLSRARITILDCTYKEPEARITAGTVTSRFEQNMPNARHSEHDRSFCDSIDFGSFASMSSLMRMIDSQRLSRINYESLSKLPENSV
ncbi:TGFBRII [Oopsacas minuta]|uniref:receptor protein serine/threonine kinase n=1 Tax=Oopsacas minuta TaxID=111878 RepID=A0AAV7JZA8_9METZ|nr:TGFBRII [Oopsacas minuta]